MIRGAAYWMTGTDDPDQIATGDLLREAPRCFGGEPFTSNDVLSLWKGGASEAIADPGRVPEP